MRATRPATRPLFKPATVGMPTATRGPKRSRPRRAQEYAVRLPLLVDPSTIPGLMGGPQAKQAGG